MVTGVGLNAPATCAALRGAIRRYQETRFIDLGGEWIMGASVPLERPWRGREKLVQLVTPAIRECLPAAEAEPSAIPLLLCVAEKGRPGRPAGLDDLLLAEVQAELGARFHKHSTVIPEGRSGGARAVALARRLLSDERLPACLVAGVDSFLVASTLAAAEARDRLLTSKNSNGYIPGEAGAAVLLKRPTTSMSEMHCLGVGFGKESATVDSEKPLRGDGLVEAFRALEADCGMPLTTADYRLTDLSGEQYGFKEASLAFSRTFRELKPTFELWHPAECFGEVGAAIGPCVLGVAATAARKGYAPGRGVLCHFSDDGGERGALLLLYEEGKRS
jgi:3-oxoacyl-[acyl-carrier-protein] synthase-1